METETISEAKQVPSVKGHWLFKGGLELSQDIIKFVQKYRPLHGDIFHVDTLKHQVYIVTHPDIVKHILQENNRNYTKSFGYKVMQLLVGHGLLTSEGEHWKKQRRLAQPAFHKERLAAITVKMAEAAEKIAEKWSRLQTEGKTVNVSDDMNEVALDIVADALFSTGISGDLEVLRKAITVGNEFVMNRIRQLIQVPVWVPLPANLAFNESMKQLDKIIYRIIESRKQEAGNKHNDLLSMLMEAKDEETGEGMSDLQLHDEVMTIFIAGHETTAVSLAWLFYLLSKHPEVENKLREELKTVLNGKTPAFEDLPKLRYTRQVIDESLRIYPPAWIVGRMSLGEDEIDGYHIPKDSTMLMISYAIHRHPRYWKDPEKFDPERFSPERAKEIHKYAYFPFGGGPRLCIGNNFALLEMQIIVATMLQKFQLRMLTDEVPAFEQLITLRPQHGIKMKFV